MDKKAFENIVGKGENQYFLLFPQCFLLYQRHKSPFLTTFKLSSANALNLDQSKTLSFGKGLTLSQIKDSVNNILTLPKQ